MKVGCSCTEATEYSLKHIRAPKEVNQLRVMGARAIEYLRLTTRLNTPRSKYKQHVEIKEMDHFTHRTAQQFQSKADLEGRYIVSMKILKGNEGEKRSRYNVTTVFRKAYSPLGSRWQLKLLATRFTILIVVKTVVALCFGRRSLSAWVPICD